MSKRLLMSTVSAILCFGGKGCATLTEFIPTPVGTLISSPKGKAALESASVPSVTSRHLLSADTAFIAERARQAYQTGRWDVAEGYYLQLTRLQPNNAEVWFELGNLYAEQGRLDAAQRAYQESLRRRDEAKTLHNLGLVQIKLGIGALREAQKRLPPDDPAHQETRAFLRTLLETVF